MNYLIGLLEIKYTEVHVEKKINFFFNYLKHYAHYIGQSPFYPQDNLLSISQRLLFQLKHNRTNCKKYLRGLRRSFNEVNHEVYSSLTSLEDVVKILNDKADDDEASKFIKDNEQIGQYLGHLVEELEDQMVKLCVDRLKNRLACEHELEEHLTEIKDMTQVIVTELVFQNHSINEIIELVKRVLSNDINFFPLKEEIEQLRGTDSFETIATDFMKDRNFSDQLEGIHHFYAKEAVEKYFIFRVDNIDFFTDQSFNINGVTFMSKDEDKFKLIKKRFRDKESVIKFWNVEDSCFAFTKVSFFETEIGKKKAMMKIQHAVNHINGKLDTNAIIYKRGYIKTSDFEQAGSRQGLGKSDIMIRKDRLDLLQQDSVHSMLTGVTSKAKDEMIYNEALYQRASLTGSTADYWHYLECLVNNTRKKRLDGVPLCNYIAEILSQFLNKDHKHDIALSIFETFRTNTTRGDNREFTTVEIIKFTQDIEGTDILKLTERFDNSTLDELKRLFNKCDSIDFQNQCFRYLRSIFVELYECRNNHVHMNYSSERSISKIEKIVPYFTRKLRFIITESMKECVDKNLHSILEGMQFKYNETKNAQS